MSSKQPNNRSAQSLQATLPALHVARPEIQWLLFTGTRAICTTLSRLALRVWSSSGFAMWRFATRSLESGSGGRWGLPLSGVSCVKGSY